MYSFSGLRRLIRSLSVSDAGSLKSYLIKSAGGSFGLTIANTALLLVSGVFTARVMGVAGYGVYSIALAWIQILLILVTLGLPSLIIRDVAILAGREQWGLLRGLLIWTNRLVSGASLLMMGLGALGIWLLSTYSADHYASDTFWEALLLLPLMGLTALRGATLRGLRRVVLGQLPDSLIMPFLTLALMFGYWLYSGRDTVQPEVAMWLRVIAVTLAFGVGVVFLYRALPSGVKEAEARYESVVWAKSIFPFLMLGGVQVFNAQVGVVLLGIWGSASDVGGYRVAVLAAGVIAFGASAANSGLAPVFARLYSEGEFPRLQRLITMSARVVFVFTLPVVLVLILFGRNILSFLLDAEYEVAWTTLAILALGQFVNASTATVAIILNMSGHERETMRGISMGAVLNVVLCVVLIPIYKADGAAIAMACSTVVWTGTLVVFVRQRLGLSMTALGKTSRV